MSPTVTAVLKHFFSRATISTLRSRSTSKPWTDWYLRVQWVVLQTLKVSLQTEERLGSALTGRIVSGNQIRRCYNEGGDMKLRGGISYDKPRRTVSVNPRRCVGVVAVAFNNIKTSIRFPNSVSRVQLQVTDMDLDHTINTSRKIQILSLVLGVSGRIGHSLTAERLRGMM